LGPSGTARIKEHDTLVRWELFPFCVIKGTNGPAKEHKKKDNFRDVIAFSRRKKTGTEKKTGGAERLRKLEDDGRKVLRWYRSRKAFPA